MAEIASSTLPDYENPPVIEVVCGILFKPLETLLMPHFGLLWEKFRSDYPYCKEVSPLAPVIEDLGEPLRSRVKFTDVPPLPRIWFLDSNDNEIIQVQRDRFLYNWKKNQKEDEYPRYRSVFHTFENHLSTFQAFLHEIKLEAISPLQYEMTYVNHILQGEGWKENRDIGKVFPDFVWRVDEERFLSPPERINWQTSFTLPNQVGRLHVRIQNGVRRKDERPLLVLELTARGIGKNKSVEAMPAWFDLAHAWIVRGFADLTSSLIQKDVWRRKDNASN